jgi:PhnB protein
MEQVMKEINAYLIFDGNCREAMTFYEKCLGGDLQLMPFSAGPCTPPEGSQDRIMHARLANGPALLMASDTMPGMPFQQGSNFSLSITCESAQETDRLFTALSENGKVTMPLQETFWAARFGMFTDRFGINWMLNFERPKQ